MVPKTEWGKKESITKRTFLKLVGVAVGGGAMSAGSGTARAASRPSVVVDLGTLGLQPGMDLTPWLAQYWLPGFEVHVPGGEYTLSDPDAIGIDGTDDAWLIGDGDVIADHGSQHIEFNFSSRGDAHVRVRNFTLRGVDTGDDSKIRAIAWDPTGLVELINFNRPDGTVNGSSGTGLFVPQQHAGVVRFINCHIENFSDNGLYGSSPALANDGANGAVEVYGGLYKNNDVAGVRIGSDNCIIQSVAIVNDATAPTDDGGPGVQRGIRIRHDGANISVDDCDVYHLDVPGVGGPFEVEDGHDDFGPNGSTVVTNTRIWNDTGINAINTETDEYDISGDNIHLTGNGDLDIDGTYTNVFRGSDATEPTTEKRWYDWDGTTDRVDVSTVGASDIEETTATLEGSLDDLGGAATADVYFEYREAGTTTWAETPRQTFSAPTGYTAPITGLTPATDYEFRAAAIASDGDVDVGAMLTFTTATPVSVDVSTTGASGVGDTAATLEGSLDDLGNAGTAEVYFEYREAGTTTWTETPRQTYSVPTGYTQLVTGLSENTDYEFRAAALGSDGTTDTGAVLSFTTTSPPVKPTIDLYEVTEAGLPNPHANITAQWAVSDANGDLATVLVEVFEVGSSGPALVSSETPVTGGTASGTDDFQIKKVRGQSFDVTITVTDNTNRPATDTERVTADSSRGN
jgi:hypothetical protein